MSLAPRRGLSLVPRHQDVRDRSAVQLHIQADPQILDLALWCISRMHFRWLMVDQRVIPWVGVGAGGGAGRGAKT